jgi:hypothetical protein
MESTFLVINALIVMQLVSIVLLQVLNVLLAQMENFYHLIHVLRHVRRLIMEIPLQICVMLVTLLA